MPSSKGSGQWYVGYETKSSSCSGWLCCMGESRLAHWNTSENGDDPRSIIPHLRGRHRVSRYSGKGCKSSLNGRTHPFAFVPIGAFHVSPPAPSNTAEGLLSNNEM